MNRILVILTLDMDQIPANFQDILQHERAVVAKWKDEGILEHLYLRQTKNGAVLIFKTLNLEQVSEKMKELPLYPLRKSIELLPLIKDMEL